MIKKEFRIHGDNFVECERLLEYLLDGRPNPKSKIIVSYPSLSTKKLSFTHGNTEYQVVLLSGFNKSTKERWDKDIFACLKNNGCFLNETPDALLTEMTPDGELLLCAVEFCSALQAGNQAWQRSGRALSIARTGCPYLYIVDIGNTELNPDTREEKAPRIPNPVVPYSYISLSNSQKTFVAEVCVASPALCLQSENFRQLFQKALAGDEIKNYIWSLASDKHDKAAILRLSNKNRELTKGIYLSYDDQPKKKWTKEVWNVVLQRNLDVLDYAAGADNKLKYNKKVAKKSFSVYTEKIIEILSRKSKGCVSSDLPFCVVPGNLRTSFVHELGKEIKISLPKRFSESKDLVVCLLKSFKPRGDDARPDRGALPLIHMLNKNGKEVLLYIYGPLLKKTQCLLKNNKFENLIRENGLWNAFFSLADYILIDSPVLSDTASKSVSGDMHLQFIDNEILKRKRLSNAAQGKLLNDPIGLIPRRYQEEDVDFALHNLFTEFLKEYCFEGMCNPPGGDWSGLSLALASKEYRWLSLPRASENKRPDHVIIYRMNRNKPILLLIESKENLRCLSPEDHVGEKMKNFVSKLIEVPPNVERVANSWSKSSATVSEKTYAILSAGAYISDDESEAIPSPEDFTCDMLFVFRACSEKNKWKLCIRAAKCPEAKALANHIYQNVTAKKSLFEVEIQ